MYLHCGVPEPSSEELSGFLFHWCRAEKSEKIRSDQIWWFTRGTSKRWLIDNVPQDAADKPSWGQRSSCGEGLQWSPDDEPGWADNAELTVCTAGWPTPSPRLSPATQRRSEKRYSSAAARSLCVLPCVNTVPAVAETEAWHPTVSGTGSSSSSAG